MQKRVPLVTFHDTGWFRFVTVEVLLSFRLDPFLYRPEGGAATLAVWAPDDVTIVYRWVVGE